MARTPVFMDENRVKFVSIPGGPTDGEQWAAHKLLVGAEILTPAQAAEGEIMVGGSMLYITATYSGVSHGKGQGGLDEIFEIAIRADPSVPEQAQYLGAKCSMPTKVATINRYESSVDKINAGQSLPWWKP